MFVYCLYVVSAWKLLMTAMKRRTADTTKLRRPIKRSRITDSVNGSWLLYLRFFIIWLLIITMDFMLEFRFEFLWPCWLLIKSSFDSFRYQGMGLTILFLLITIFSDVLFFIFLPVQWLFFVASTYVWVQFVCNTDRGPCLATVSLWLVFVYVEASVRLRDIITVPFHLDLCRPFAAHCIGYPVVSLGYGFKSYVGFKLKNLRQKEVCKQNTFYHQLVSYALPMEILDDSIQQRKTFMLTNGINTKSDIEALMLTNEPRRRGLKLTDLEERQGNSSLSLNDLAVVTNAPIKDITKKSDVNFDQSEVGFTRVPSNSNKGSVNFKSVNNDVSVSSNKRTNTKTNKKLESDDDLENSESEESTSSSRLSQDSSPKSGRISKLESLQTRLKEEQAQKRKSELQIALLENEVKKLRSELSSTRQSEAESRTQVNASLITERYLKQEIEQLKSDNESLQLKVNSLTSLKTQDKALISSLERKLKSEKESRLNLETQLKETKKRTNKPDVESSSSPRVENHDACISRIQELEFELKVVQGKYDETMLNVAEMNKENSELKRKNSENEREKMKKDVEYLTGALNLMQGKNLHLESSLSSETRLKLDLFSALGDTRRQLEIVQTQMKGKCNEVDLLKAKIAEVMAVMPPQYHSSLQSFVSQTDSSTYLKTTPVDTVVTTVGYSQSPLGVSGKKNGLT